MPENQQYSQKISTLLGRPPSWMVQYGTAVLFGIVLLLLLGAATVRYPDTITGKLVVTATQPVASIYTKKTGRLTHVFAARADTVAAGTWLAVIESAVKLEKVQELIQVLNIADSLVGNSDSLPQLQFPQGQLGELQPVVNQWRLAYVVWANFNTTAIYPRKLEAMRAQLGMYGQYYERSWSQRLVMQEQYDLAEVRYVADSTLAFSGVIAPLELKQRKEEFLNRRFALHGARSALAQLQITMRELEKKIAETEAEYQTLQEQNLQNYQTTAAQVQAAIAQWLELHVLISPIDGVVQLQRPLGPNTTVPANVHAISIEPLQPSEPHMLVSVPPQRASKIKVGQRVQGKLDAYPFEEFGMLIGTVTQVSTAPSIDADGAATYWVTASLTTNRTTVFGKSIAQHTELFGVGEIVTEDLSLLDRLLFQLRKIWGR